MERLDRAILCGGYALRAVAIGGALVLPLAAALWVLQAHASPPLLRALGDPVADWVATAALGAGAPGTVR